MAIIPPPTSQKSDQRPISFLLVDPTTPQVLSSTTTITLAVRPEDLTRTDPSRMTVHQTLGGAYMDNFGPGISNIIINGHTGWHRSQEGVQTPDGMARWFALRDQVFTNWHAKKQNAIKAGRDPDQIQLIFADKLDKIVCVVATAALVLRRSRARPLLYQYQLNMTVLDDNINPPLNTQTPQLIANSPSDLQQAALTSSTISISRLQAFAQAMAGSLSTVASTINAAASVFTATAAALYSAVNTAITTASQTVAPLISAAGLVANAGLNLFQSIAALSPTTFEKAFAMQVAGEFSNMACLFFNNAFNQQIFYQQYTGLYGSSNCSSTNGGAPPSDYAINGTNPFLDVVPTTPQPPFTIATSSLESLKALANNDPVLRPFTISQMKGYLTSINSGFSVKL